MSSRAGELKCMSSKSRSGFGRLAGRLGTLGTPLTQHSASSTLHIHLQSLYIYIRNQKYRQFFFYIVSNKNRQIIDNNKEQYDNKYQNYKYNKIKKDMKATKRNENIKNVYALQMDHMFFCRPFEVVFAMFFGS